MAAMTVGLYLGGSILGQTALLSPWLAFLLNFLFVLLLIDVYKRQPYKVSKDGGEIQAISGATITSRAVTNGVNQAVETVKLLGGGAK